MHILIVFFFFFFQEAADERGEEDGEGEERGSGAEGRSDSIHIARGPQRNGNACSEAPGQRLGGVGSRRAGEAADKGWRRRRRGARLERGAAGERMGSEDHEGPQDDHNDDHETRKRGRIGAKVRHGPTPS